MMELAHLRQWLDYADVRKRALAMMKKDPDEILTGLRATTKE